MSEMKKVIKYLYRFDTLSNSPICETFNVRKKTNCGWWIDNWHFNKYNEIVEKTWVPNNAINAYAFDTKEKAIKNYIARKKKYISILKDKIYKSKELISKARTIDVSIKLLTFDYDGGF